MSLTVDEIHADMLKRARAYIHRSGLKPELLTPRVQTLLRYAAEMYAETGREMTYDGACMRYAAEHESIYHEATK